MRNTSAKASSEPTTPTAAPEPAMKSKRRSAPRSAPSSSEIGSSTWRMIATALVAQPVTQMSRISEIFRTMFHPCRNRSNADGVCRSLAATRDAARLDNSCTLADA